MGQEGEPMLRMLAEKHMQSTINPRLLAYCPTMDLLALSTTDEQVHVFRINGQRVFGVAKRDPATKVTDIKWKPDGKTISCLYLTRHVQLIEMRCLRNTNSDFDETSSLDEFIASTKGTGITKLAPSLPVELAFIDIASTLPKLSTLPIDGSQDDVFSSRISLDTLFKPLVTDSIGSADVLIVGHEDGTIHISMSEDFSIGIFQMRDADPSLCNSNPLLHCSHPSSTTHALLVSTRRDELKGLQFVPLDLRLISRAGRHLTLLASKVTELHNLLRYLHQTQQHISAEIRTSQDLPSKFMRNINEVLQEKSDCTWVQAAYHLVATGHCYPAVKEWLVDELGERGHKRWDKAVNTGYENIRRLLHESLLPALDRFIVLISRLRGLSRFQHSDFALGLSTLELDNALDSANCLQLLSHHLLKCVISELKQFGAFSVWLRHEIEKQAADPSSATAQEIAEKDMGFDHVGILAYIQGAMTQSRMLIYSGDPADSRPPWDLATEGGVLFELYKRELNSGRNDARLRKKLPGLDGLLDHLQMQSRSLFERIAETQRRKVHFGVPTSLGVGGYSCTDMRMIVEKDGNANSNLSVYIALGSSSREASVKITRIRLLVENGVSSTKTVQYLNIPVGVGTIRDVKFIDDESLILALVDQDGKLRLHEHAERATNAMALGVPRLIKVDYRLKDRFGRILSYRERSLVYGYEEAEADRRGTHGNCEIDLTNPNDMAMYTVHRFAMGKAWAPRRLEVNSRKGRRIMAILAEDNVHYRLFDIDGNQESKSSDVAVDHSEKS
ncbi:MAG: hypothetical protein Q9170_001913 [Blastenia crenularia]